ncbi:MAG: hypothetical protein K2O04_04690 [Clostridiales bacterium]|nr:hypothetical protein [Clostridiales bacterium]
MKTRIKHNLILTVLLSALCVIISAIIAIAVLTAPRKTAVAEESQDNAHGYYYSQLRNSKLAERLYNALWDMYKQGYFEKCTEQYDLTTVLTQPELGDYIINKSPAIPVALGAARDAFYLDHPELFYVSVHDMRFTFGSDGTNHQAYLGAGKADNYYEEYTVTSADEVKAAVADFNTQLDKAVAAAKKDNVDVVQQIKNANEYLCNNAEYDFGAYDDKHGGLAYNGYVNTAYGILNTQEGKAGKALCEGYAKAFKVIMDKLGIPCVLVAGPACNGLELEATYEPHMWNAVKVEGQWYGVDVCWNDTENNHSKYTLVGELFLMKSRYEDPVISSSEFKVKYPILHVLDYGNNVDDSGFEFFDNGTIDGQEFSEDTARVGISYEDKNFKQLKADGKYLAIRFGEAEPWIDYSAFNDWWVSYGNDELIVAGKYTTFYSYLGESIQFAIIDVASDSNGTYLESTVPNGGWKNLTDDHILAVSAKYNNQSSGEAPRMPFIKSMTPNEKGYIMSYDPVDISITYDEKLKYESVVSKDVDIEVTAERKDIKPTVENVVWHEDTNTITFTFTPSSPYAHNSLTYNFVPTNLIGEESGARPEAGKLAFKRDEVICPKVFNDGRLYMKIYGTPEFVSADDQSLNEFKDKNGQPIVNQRSQLMLVINRPTKAEETEMKNVAQEKIGDTVMASSTYQINLQMCGLIQKVPDGSYMQVGFGFPEGMSHEDEGTTFTVYHYTRNDDGTIKDVEAVPCVVTQYGVIATVKSFSPFMICAVSSDSPSAKNRGKMVLASIDGVGGNIDKKDIISVKNGESVTYTITKESGYEIDRVLVNGVDKKASVTAEGKLTLNDVDLGANNTVVVSFISARAAKFIADKNITVVEHSLIVTEKDMIVAVDESTVTPPTGDETVKPDPTKKPDGGSNTGMIVGIVIAVVAVLAAAGVALFFIFRKKGEPQKATSAKGKKNKTDSVKAKPAQEKTAEQAATKNTTTTAAAQRPTTTAQQRPTATPQRPAQTAQPRPTTTTTQRPATPQRPQSGAPTQRPTTTTARPSGTTAQRPQGGAPTRPVPPRPQSGTPTRNDHTDKDNKK